MFFLSTGIIVFGWLVYMLFGSAEEQDWARSFQEQETSCYDNPGLADVASTVYSVSKQLATSVDGASA